MKRQIAFNKKFTLFYLIGIVLLICTVISFSENDLELGIGLGLFSALFLIGTPFVLPCLYLYDKNGVTLVYLYMPNERYLWENIYEIRVIDDETAGARRSLIFGLVYEICGCVEGKERFYMEGRIQKSLRNKHLIQKYWNGTITGYFDDEINEFKLWRAKRKSKKLRQNKINFNEEVPALERKLRSNLINSLEYDINAAKKLGLALRIDYRYVTEQGSFHSRPRTDYTYTATVTITPKEKQDEAQTICMEVKLLSVQLKENGHRTVLHEKEQETFSNTLSDTLLSIEEANPN